MMWRYLLQANRDPDAGIDEAQVEQDAQVRWDMRDFTMTYEWEKESTLMGNHNLYCDSVYK